MWEIVENMEAQVRAKRFVYEEPRDIIPQYIPKALLNVMPCFWVELLFLPNVVILKEFQMCGQPDAVMDTFALDLSLKLSLDDMIFYCCLCDYYELIMNMLRPTWCYWILWLSA